MERQSISKKVSLYGVLIALAMLFSYIDTLIPIFPIPGMKLGLANLVVLIALYLLSSKAAIFISIVRIILVAITFGNLSAFMFSFAGAILSLCLMLIFKRTNKFSMIGVSILGAISHNIAQIVVAIIILESILIISYLPYLLVSAVVTGILIGLLGALVLKRLERGI